MKLTKLLEKINRAEPKSKLRFSAALLAALLALALYFSYLMPGEDSKIKEDAAGAAELSGKIAEILSKVEGTGEVDVLIYYGTSAKLVPAYISESENTDSVESSVYIKKDELAMEGKEALIIREDMPEITGVVVVAEGAGDILTRLRLISAVTTLLGIEQGRVEVLPM